MNPDSGEFRKKGDQDSPLLTVGVFAIIAVSSKASASFTELTLFIHRNSEIRA
jgi:hypothetical protein